MIGHRTPRHLLFGRFAARLDDAANWIPARITAVLIALASERPGQAFAAAWRDAGKHRSPNAGWPEGAMAGALAVRLSGPRVYGDRLADEPWLNGKARDPGAADLVRAIRVHRRAVLLAGLGLAVWTAISQG